MTVVRGLDNILNGGAEYLAFEEGKPKVLLFVDWYNDVLGIREHYEPALNPKYIRCPGKEVCPLCKANPGKYPGLKIKFRVYDPTDQKVKIVSLAKSHIQKLNTEFNLEEVDPRQRYVIIYRTGKGSNDTSYSARTYEPAPMNGKPDYPYPNFDELDMPDLLEYVNPHTPEQIQGFMDALLNGVQNQVENNPQTGADFGTYLPQGQQQGLENPYSGGTQFSTPQQNQQQYGSTAPQFPVGNQQFGSRGKLPF